MPVRPDSPPMKAEGVERIEKIPGTEKVYQDYDGR